MFAICRIRRFVMLAIVSICCLSPVATHAEVPSGPLAIGRDASAEDIGRWDIDIGPDGAGLPAGDGTAKQGKPMYAAKCTRCHGPRGRKDRDKLAGLSGTTQRKTIGTYWPYATTLFDYIRRAMPPSEPGSLTDDEVYALTAYILNLNSIIGTNKKMNARTLPEVHMPGRDRFVPDNRRGGPEVR
ncbi:MAG: cytochrome c [Gammaproteobacteria bacterium]|jgi:cytochrome c|nr:cytochrome c [Gammaproteobacteria bacterium]MDP7296905.1 cytochrome c [Gammaproteobacteria bacterium]MDP7420136.1 cytochrome c [Gammaproteobacteria bacterium]MDP7661362.1 cytochrome c [Gammaproteobacteria bacterium]HJP39109.1 cytochrome c [Gammaproteobacteria bacterium]